MGQDVKADPSLGVARAAPDHAGDVFPNRDILVGGGVVKMKTHEPMECPRNISSTQYVGKGYKSKFGCPICGRTIWQHLSFLGQKALFCNGQKLIKAQRDWHLDLTREMFMELFKRKGKQR